MTEEEVVVLEEDPDDEAVIDACDIEADDDELEEGARLGEVIDVDDDDDNGLDGTMGLAFTRALSDRDNAMRKAQDLKQVMLDFGAPEVSIELMEGRPNSFGRYDALFCVCEMSHHTVSRFSSSNLTPILGLCKHGRSDLGGPLCNGYGGYDLTYRILTFGYGNHPGAGGPITVPALTAGRFTVPKDSARRYAWGTEWEGGLNAGDWDRVLTNPRNGKKMTMREFMGRCNAALEKYHKIHPDAHLEHSSWTSRKIDRLGYTREEGIREKARFSQGGDWFDMATKAELKEVLDNNVPELVKAAILENIPNVPISMLVEGKIEQWPLRRVLRHLENEQDHMRTELAAIRAALANGGTTK